MKPKGSYFRKINKIYISTQNDQKIKTEDINYKY